MPPELLPGIATMRAEDFYGTPPHDAYVRNAPDPNGFAVLVAKVQEMERILDEQGVGLDYRGLLIFSAVIGFGGAFISLAISFHQGMPVLPLLKEEVRLVGPAFTIQAFLAAGGVTKSYGILRVLPVDTLGASGMGRAVVAAGAAARTRRRRTSGGRSSTRIIATSSRC